jgi:hypothetical protein
VHQAGFEPTVAEDRDKMSDDELVASAGDPDEYSEGSGNPDEDWDGVDAVDEDDSKVVLPMNDGIEPGSARFFGRHKEYMQCLTRIIGLLDDCSGC